MEVIHLLTRAVKMCAEVIKWGSGIQSDTRKALVDDLQRICLNCNDAYDTVIKRLVPVKGAFSDNNKLADELRAFASDSSTRDKFKPEHICGQVDHLLVQLSSNLDPLKYSVDLKRIKELRDILMRYESVDAAIYQSYDDLTSELDQIATQIKDPIYDANERASYAKHIIADFEAELRSSKRSLREAKKQTVAII